MSFAQSRIDRDASWERLRIGREQHAFIAGATGSGKSVLARFLVLDPLKQYSVVWDPKHSRTVSQWPGQKFIYSFDELEGSEERRIVYRPPIEAGESAEEQLRFFRWIFEQGHVRCYVDECVALLDNQRGNLWFRACLQMGRELGVSMVCATQRPVSIPIITMSEASRVFVFRLNWPEDQERIKKITGISEREQQALGKHEFFCWSSEHGRIGDKFKLSPEAVNRGFIPLNRSEKYGRS